MNRTIAVLRGQRRHLGFVLQMAALALLLLFAMQIPTRYGEPANMQCGSTPACHG